MDQNTARALFDAGACLVILDAPTGIEFGIDLDTWETGPLFKGLKMIPPGIHYIHYSAVNGDKQPGMRCGFFHSFSTRDVVAKRWCPDSEDLVIVNTEDTERIRQHIRDLDKGLGAYQTGDDHATYTRWQQLTSMISPELLHQVLPPSGCFSSATGSAYEDEELASVRKRLLRRMQGMSETESLNSIINSEALNTDPTSSDRFRFTEIDIRHSFRKDATPDEIRRFSQDKSWLLRTVLDQVGSARLLGEFQLAFLVIFVGQNFAGLEHWKRILHMVLGSSDVMADPQIVDDVIVSVLRILGQQLRECPREFVASVLEQDNFVAEILQMLVLNVYESEQSAARGVLEPEIARLRELLGTFDWVLPEGCQLKEEADLEEGEYAPQIVDL